MGRGTQGGSAVEQEQRLFCVKIDLRHEASLILSLSAQGAVVGDECRSVLWLRAPMTEREVEGMPGVLKAIECVRPLRPDVLNQGVGGGTTSPMTSPQT